MSSYEISAPVSDFAGSVAGLNFTAGRAVAVDLGPSALAYFRRHGYTVATDDQATEPDGPPAKSAAKSAWVEFAMARGIDRAEAEGMTRDQLAETYGGTNDGPS
ncbi:hypothetical protein [Embleya hyalina]|uniref:Uncharacterized protein n=1 Tax=Embleya hyalina TaxID=516124 RepID=A0A401YHM0_9ACTN|nr:hypothetical protein [Embleya hyalina]GCD94069.1 hypothetical protein EHYA_01725 [Embleya hyalina]